MAPRFITSTILRTSIITSPRPAFSPVNMSTAAPNMYNNKIFRPASNSSNGEVDNTTRFHYHQDRSIVWAEYSGGSIARGSLIATVKEDGSLDMRYHHVNTEGELMTGKCKSVPETLEDGRLRLKEAWQWTSGDGSNGESVLEEVKEEGARGEGKER